MIETEMLQEMTPEFIDVATATIPLSPPGITDDAAAMIEVLSSLGCSFSARVVPGLSGGSAA